MGLGLEVYTKEELEAELKRRDMMMPEVVKFKFYLHNDHTRREIQDLIEDQTDVAISADLAEKVQANFYEIEFNVTLNTTTGEVTIDNIR